MSGFFLSEPPPDERFGAPWWERWLIQPLAIVVAGPILAVLGLLRFVRRLLGLDPTTGLGRREYPRPLGPWRRP